MYQTLNWPLGIQTKIGTVFVLVGLTHRKQQLTIFSNQCKENTKLSLVSALSSWVEFSGTSVHQSILFSEFFEGVMGTALKCLGREGQEGDEGKGISGKAGR